MTVRALKELLACLPDDVLGLAVSIEIENLTVPCRMVLIDPPGNWDGSPPRVVLTDDPCDETDPEIIAMVKPRHS